MLAAITAAEVEAGCPTLRLFSAQGGASANLTCLFSGKSRAAIGKIEA
jgi:hypothetical protein